MEVKDECIDRIKAIKEHYHKQSILILQDVAEERGIAKGELSKEKENVESLFNYGMSKEEIAKALNLDLEYVNELLKK